MRTIKKICAIILSLCLTVGILAVAAFAQDVPKEVTLRYDGPTTFKIGDMISDEDNCVYFENLDPAQKAIIPDFHSKNGNYLDDCVLCPQAFGDAGENYIDENGRASTWLIYFKYGTFYKPGTFTYQYSYNYCPNVDIYEEYEEALHGEFTPVGDPITFTIEEPIIKTNLPKSVKVNDSITLTTELTNVNLENKDVAYYLNKDNYEYDPQASKIKVLKDDGYHHSNEAAYQPSVEILEGADIVSQSDQDYSNTLKSSETLTFTGSGTVKLKVKYTQFVTSSKQAEFDYSSSEPEFIRYDTYSPEKIITVQVTDGEASTASQYSVIKGANSSWDSGSGEDLTLTSNGDFSKFKGIMIDNEILDAENYEAKSGSTVVTLKSSYLKTLNSGKHTVTFVYTDGEANTQIEIKRANNLSNSQNAEIPNTDSEFGNTQVIIAFVMSIAVIALVCGAVAVRDKKYFVK